MAHTPPKNIGLIGGPFGWTLWNSDDFPGQEADAIQYVLADPVNSAAPELLEALKVVARGIHPGDDRLGDTFADLSGEQTEQIFAAIAKAEASQ